MNKFRIFVCLLIAAFLGVIYYIEVPLEHSTIAAVGDTVTYSYTGTLADGRNVKDVNKDSSEYTTLTIGDMQQPETLENAFIGHKRGENIDGVVVQYGSDESYGDLKDQTVTYNLFLSDIQVCKEGNECFVQNEKALKESGKTLNKVKDYQKEFNKLNSEFQKQLDNNEFDKVQVTLSKMQNASSNASTQMSDYDQTVKYGTRPEVKEQINKEKEEAQNICNEMQTTVTQKQEEFNKKFEENKNKEQ